MKDLVLAIRAHLRADNNLSYVQAMSIFITPDEDLIPNQVKLPAISIKDGSIKNDQELCNNYLQSALVKVTVYQQIFKPEESIVGTHGVLEMAADVIASLIGNKLGLTGIENVFPIGEGESQVMGRENEMMQMKVISFLYMRHKVW